MTKNILSKKKQIAMKMRYIIRETINARLTHMSKFMD